MIERLRMHRRSVVAWAKLAPWAPAMLGGVDGLLRARARAHPRRACLRDPRRRLSYGQVEAAANQAAALWSRRGLGRGDVVAFIAGNHLEVLIQQIGLARIGAAAALVNPQLQGASLVHVIRAAGARWAVVEAGRETPPGVRALSLAALQAERQAADSKPARLHLKRMDTPACYLFTSGTTGLPKAAPISHARYLLCGAALQAHAVWLKPSDVVFTPLPIYHASAQLIGWSMALSAGACFAIAPGFSARAYWDQAATVGATVGLYVGELCRYLLAGPERPAHGVHTFVGNGLRADVWAEFQRRFGVRIVEFYGATEGNTLLINRTGKVGSCGRPIIPAWLSGLQLAEFDVERETHVRRRERLVKAAAGEPGELLARISWLPIERFDGYVDRQATADKVIQGAFRERDRFFRSGDLLRKDSDGDYFFVDRIGDTFRWRGENVSTQEVAEALAGVPGVEAVVVYGVEVPGEEGRAGMAAFVGQPDMDAFFAAAQALPKYARPQFLRRVESLARTSTMKFKKAGLVRDGFADCGEDAVWRLTADGYR